MPGSPGEKGPQQKEQPAWTQRGMRASAPAEHLESFGVAGQGQAQDQRQAHTSGGSLTWKEGRAYVERQGER